MSLDSLANGWTKALSVDKKHFNMFFDRMLDGFAYHKIVVDKEGRPVDYVFIEVNKAFELLTGFKREEIVGKKVTDVLKGIEKDPTDWIGRYGKVALTCEPAQFENYAQSLDRWYKVSAYCPEKGYFVALFEDITERKKAEQALKDSETRFRLALKNSPVSVSAQDTNLRYVWAFNQRTATPEQIIGKLDSEIFTPKEATHLDQVKRRVLEEDIELREQSWYKRPSGRIYLDVTWTPLHDDAGNVIGVASATVDLTNIKLTEEALQKLNDELEERVNQRTEQILKERQRLYNVLETLPSYVILLDKNYGVPFANKVFRETFGESKGSRCYEFLFNRNSACENCETYKVLKTNKPHRWEWTGPNGRDYDIYDFPFYEADGSIQILEMGLDITDRKKAEVAVQTERKRLFDVLETLPAMICLLTPDYEVVFANRSFREKFGESKGRRCYDYCFHKKAPCEFCESYKVLETGKPHHWEVNTPDGNVIDAYDFPFRDADGSPLILEMDMDITAQRHAEKELQRYKDHLEQLVKERTSQLHESEQRWATTLSSIGDAVIATDTQGIITFINSVAEELTGWTFSDAKNKSINQIFRIINETTRQPAENPIAKVLTHGVVMGLANHTLLIRKNGVEIPIDDSAAPIRTASGQISGVVLVFRDITERKITQEALQRQADLIDLSPDAIIVRAMDGTITFWSKGAEKLYGWTKEEVLGKKTHDIFATKFPEPLELIVDQLKATMRWSGELIHRTKQGNEVTVQSWWLSEKTEHGEIKSILESNVDLTERKNSEKEIERLASFPRLNPSPILEVDFDGNLTYINPATATLFPELPKTGIDHIFLSDWKSIVKTFENHHTATSCREIKIGDHWYNQQFYLVPQTRLIRIYTTNVDELKQSEEERIRAQTKLEKNAVMLEEYASQMEELAEKRARQLQNAERMVAIGQTAGMVGHDIRNPLQAITTDMYLIAQEAKRLPEGKSKTELMESITSINDNLVYINKIVSDLQDYTKPVKPNFQNADLSALLNGAILTIRIPESITVTTDVKEDAKPIRTDVIYLRRILTNIITNGIQAMQDQNEGKLDIKATRWNNITTIIVQDTGVGIPQEVREKVFTPLFTTKSKGQGLGLAVVKRLVEGLGGTIEFVSELNEGTKFTINLPEPK